MTEPLLVIDMQNLVVARAWQRDRVITTIADLVTRARAAGTPVIWVRHHAEHLVRGSNEWQIVDELVPLPDEPIVEKTHGDAFIDTNLEALLRECGATGMVIAGAESNACIRSTFTGALYRGQDATLVADANTTTDLPEEYGGFSAEWMVAYTNLTSEHTEVPGVRSAVVAASDLTFTPGPDELSDTELSEQVLAEEAASEDPDED